MNRISLIVSIVAVLLVIIAMVGLRVFPNIIAKTFMKPNRQPMVKTPSDYGLEYENVEINTKDGVKLAAWLIRGTNDKVIILGHPGTFSKYGYSLKHEGFLKSGYDKDVEFIPTAKHLHDAGYTVLMYDQRNHGESGATLNGAPHDLPANVYHDAVAVAKYMTEHPDFQGQDIGLMAICMNSMINMVAMSKESEEMKKTNVKAMTVIQPHAVDLWFERVGIPKFVINQVNKIYKKNGVSELSLWNPMPFVKDIYVPALFVQNVNDKTSDISHMHDVYNAIPTEKEAIWIDDKDEKHRFYTYNYFNYYPEKLITFFDKYLD